MNLNADILKNNEKIIYSLRMLYQRYGYSQYKMSKFEEYDLYARNKDFLVSDNIITFTDTSGKLMALKPDMTLSIVRSSRPDPDTVQKVYYNENVYRIAKGSHSFREITQVGLECIGALDEYQTAEVLTLAAMSLKEISQDCVLDISHLGIISTRLDALGLTDTDRNRVLKCIGEKNLHDLTSICEQAGADAQAIADLKKLLSCGGTPESVLPVLKELRCDPKRIRELENIVSVLKVNDCADVLRIDFSVVNTMNYYNGIVFEGFVSGVPARVISGGRYDRLMRKMGKNCGAIGFAVYHDQLERLTDKDPVYDVDTVLLYTQDTAAETISRIVKHLTDSGISVTVQKSVPEKLKYRQLVRVDESGVEVIEQNA